MRWQMAPLTSLAFPNQEFTILEVSVGLLILKDTPSLPSKEGEQPMAQNKTCLSVMQK